MLALRCSTASLQQTSGAPRSQKDHLTHSCSACSARWSSASRRPVLFSLLGLAAGCVYVPRSSAKAALAQLLEAGAQVTNPGVQWALGVQSKQLFYPQWMAGRWRVSARLVGVSSPLGQRFVLRTTPGVTKASMIASVSDVGASMDQPVQFEAQFRRTSTQDEASVVADRAFNYQQQTNAFLGREAVQSVVYDPDKDPTQVAILYTTVRKDGVSMDQRKANLFLNNRSSQIISESCYVTSELVRQVNQAQNQGSVGDYEVISEFCRQADGTVHVRQRNAAFLQPQDALYFDVGNKAVALYDYAYDMTRVQD